MRKLTFYPKLALSNLWRNRSTYLPYMLACVTCVVTFYTLLAINASGSLAALRGAEYVQSFMLMGLFIIAAFFLVLLLWTNGFLIRRRKKELGLYSILGMEKRNIAAVMFFETLFVGIVTIGVGLVAGMLLARLLFLLLLKLARFDVVITLPVSGSAIATTAVIMMVFFLLCLVRNLRQVRLASPVELMAGEKQGEKEPKASWLITLLGIVTLGTGYGMALLIKDSISAILLFVVAAFFVIVGTYCLFTSGSIAWLKLMRRRKGYYYQPKHFITVSGMLWRMKANAAGLASICILSCMVLVTVASTLTLYLGTERSVDLMYPSDFDIYAAGEDTGAVERAVDETVAETGIGAAYETWHGFSAFTEETEAGYIISMYWNSGTKYKDFTLVSEEEYKRLSGEDVTLAPGQALLFENVGAIHSNTLTLEGHTYSLQKLEAFPFMASFNTANSDHLILVVPNEDWRELVLYDRSLPYLSRGEEPVSDEELLAGVRMHTIVELPEGTTEEEGELFRAGLNERLGNTVETYRMYVRADMRDEFYIMNGGFIFLGAFFGTIFLLAAAMIIYYKQMSEGYEDRERFDILQKVGLSAKEVRKAIASQVRAVFYLPVGAAAVHIGFAYFMIEKAVKLMILDGSGPLLWALGATVLVYAALYWLIYKQTARTYYKIVRREG